MWLVTWSAQNKVSAAETYVQDGIEYETIYLTDNNSSNLSELKQRANTDGNYRYVMTADWDLVAGTQWSLVFYGNSVIFDFNGYMVRCTKYDGTSGSNVGLRFSSVISEITDSSAKHTGGITNSSTFFSTYGGDCQTMIISGGNISAGGYIDLYDSVDFIIRGGSCTGLGDTFGLYRDYTSDHAATITFAPWIVPSYHDNGVLSGWTSLERSEVIDGIEYETIYLTNDSADNMRKINMATATGNYHYVMLNGWNLVTSKAKPYFYGAHVILDCNSHALTATNYANGGYLPRFCVTESLEITSSGKGTVNLNPIVFNTTPQTLIISGNIGIYYHENLHLDETQVIIRGTQYIYFNCDAEYANRNFIVAPYLNLKINSANQVTYAPSHTAYAISTSNVVPGRYNYEFSLGWDLTVGELSKLAVPDDKTYYLWGRNGNGEYEYLNVVYRDGAWVSAA